MDVYEAIAEMRRMTKAGKSFSFSFMTFSHTRQKSHGVSEVRKARLAPQDPDNKHVYKDFMLQFLDLDTNETKQCYQPLLMEFEGQKLELN